MAHNNTANTGATQNNVVVDVALNKDIHYHIAIQAMTVTVAQQSGSPLGTRYSHDPLNELMQSINNADITTKRYHGDGIYNRVKDNIMNALGKGKRWRWNNLVVFVVALTVWLRWGYRNRGRSQPLYTRKALY
ncbi:hypothetical protein F4818DRAFT_405162 [Hypoxylon cercidicola]|nr:hypothetical protein F4818DRAFT_405162 [Hypoxylon cercidicola]